MMENNLIQIDATKDIENLIYTIRGKQVMLDSDLAKLYQVETKQLIRQMKRNIERFPIDFCFQIENEEFENLRCQFGTSSLKNNYGGRRYNPYVFTEQGISMLSSVLRSKIATEISIKIIRTFVQMRKYLLTSGEIFSRLDKIETKQIENKLEADKKFDEIFDFIASKQEITQGIFFNGQIFDAYNFVADLIRKAKKKIILVDNYIDDTTLSLFNKNQNIEVIIYTHTINKTLALDLEKYNKQYKEINIKINKDFHDRFLIIDEKEVYLIGASLKDLGKKVFGFSLLKDINPKLLKLK